jgi:hypothetical protein
VRATSATSQTVGCPMTFAQWQQVGGCLVILGSGGRRTWLLCWGDMGLVISNRGGSRVELSRAEGMEAWR